MNSAGAELTANLIYERLKPLKELAHLTQFHQAFELRDLLKPEGTASRFDDRFEELSLGPITISEERRQAIFWSGSGMYNFAYSIFDEGGVRRVMINSRLERDGKLATREEKFYDTVSGKLQRKRVFRMSEKKVQWTEEIHSFT